MCGGDLGQLVNKTVDTVTGGGKGQAPSIGQPDTAKTQIGDSGAAVVPVGQRRKARSLLSGTALGDASAAGVSPVTAKPTLGG